MNPEELSFSDVLQGPPVELQEIENEISRPLLRIDAPLDEQSQSLIADAVMRRSCNPLQIHLRLKQGFNSDATLTRRELQDLSSLFFSNDANANTKCKPLAHKLAKFYVRIANIRARIIEDQQQQQQQQQQHQQQQQQQQQQQPGTMDPKLQRAYDTQKENMRNKQRENQAHISRIMRTIMLDPDSQDRCIHPELKEADLDALEQQVQDILESGCATHELRCIKIMEAAMEQQKYDALIAELNALNEMLGLQ
jgi:hypothetical protein